MMMLSTMRSTGVHPHLAVIAVVVVAVAHVLPARVVQDRAAIRVVVHVIPAVGSPVVGGDVGVVLNVDLLDVRDLGVDVGDVGDVGDVPPGAGAGRPGRPRSPGPSWPPRSPRRTSPAPRPARAPPVCRGAPTPMDKLMEGATSVTVEPLVTTVVGLSVVVSRGRRRQRSVQRSGLGRRCRPRGGKTARLACPSESSRPVRKPKPRSSAARWGRAAASTPQRRG